MAQRRMVSLDIIDTDAFLDMPVSSQLLYFHLNARADDDGFVASPRKIARMLGTQSDDLNVLIAKKFIISFKEGICVIKHWRINNFIRKDIYKETKYVEAKKSLYVRPSGVYTTTSDERAIPIPNGHFKLEDIHVNEALTKRQPRLGKVRKGKERLEVGEVKTSPINKVSFSEEDLEMSKLLYSKILENNPHHKKPNFDTWSNHIRLMRERDNRTIQQIEFVINWCQQDNFWQANILSTNKLREKFDTLVAQIKRSVDKDKLTKNSIAFT